MVEAQDKFTDPAFFRGIFVRVYGGRERYLIRSDRYLPLFIPLKVSGYYCNSDFSASFAASEVRTC